MRLRAGIELPDSEALIFWTRKDRSLGSFVGGSGWPRCHEEGANWYSLVWRERGT